VLSPHEVTEFAFDFGSCGPVVVLPFGALLLLAGSGEDGFVDPDSDGAPGGRVGARLSQRTVGAGVGEVGDAGAVSAAADGDGDVVGAGDGVGVEIDPEPVFTEPAPGRRRRLGPAPGVDVVVFEMLLELAGPIGGVAVDGRVVMAARGCRCRSGLRSGLQPPRRHRRCLG
jgi:hypothetical protein